MKRVLLQIMLSFGVIAAFSGCTLFSFDTVAPLIATDVESCELRGSVSEGQARIEGGFSVNSNQSWSAQVVYSAAEELDWISLLQTEYENVTGKVEESMLSFVLGPNDADQPREAVIKLTSQDCEKTVKVVQKPADPYVMIMAGQSLEMEPDATGAALSIIANRTWTAELKDASKWEGFVLNTTSGEKEGSALSMSFRESYTATPKEAVITLTPAGGEPSDITVTQNGLVVIVDFVSQPFTTDIGTSKSEQYFGEYILSWYGTDYKFALSGNSGTALMYYEPYDGKTISKGAVIMSKGWVDLPAVSGMALTKVTMTAGATNKKWLITEPLSTAAVQGGGQVTLAKPGDSYTWTLTDPKENHVYSLYTSTTSCRVKYIKLIYR